MTRDRARRILSIVHDPADALPGEPPVRWAVEQLREATVERGCAVRVVERIQPDDLAPGTMVVAGSGSSIAGAVLDRARVPVLRAPESLGLVPGTVDGREILLICGTDTRGLVYGVLEMADRIAHANDPMTVLEVGAPIVEEPANTVRSVARLFASEINDKEWFHDEDFWRRYLTMLVTQRFNRFSLTLGLGYNFPRHVTDAYLYFAYPFLVSLPAYDVRVPQLPQRERERNLEMIRFVSEQAVARGLDFQLGLWTHAYEWVDSPNAHHTIEGLLPSTHAKYCRDALQTLLEECPAIGGVTFRTHGESGIPERSWDFWRVLLQGVVRSGRRVGIDLHAKGLDAETLQIALDTGLPVSVSPKYWAEHMGLPYHQAGIRELERGRSSGRSRTTDQDRFVAVSEGSRPFTRYGYADFLREDRDYDVVFRVWPGTQRLLLWGDPAMAAGYGRHASLAGSQGIEWCEPLSFKGREGSGLPGSRTGYADPSLVPKDDWEKYSYSYRLFGRLTYEPDTEPETWRRHLRAQLGTAAGAAEKALANASRILPLVTCAHHPSASNNYYWPEIYTDMPIVERAGETRPHPYIDTPSPRRFGTVDPLDPEIFSSVEAFVSEVLTGEQSGRYSPLAVAGWLQGFSENAARHLHEMAAQLAEPTDPYARRLVADVAIQEALGRFFAGKLRAAVLFEISQRTESSAFLHEAVDAYKVARRAWMDATHQATRTYSEDLTFGREARLRGHWSDRLAAIDADLADMEALSYAHPAETAKAELSRRLIQDPARDPRDGIARHDPPRAFSPGSEVRITLQLERNASAVVASVRLRHRHLDQSKPYREMEMERRDDGFVGVIESAYSDSAYPLAYFFVVQDARGRAWLHPGLAADLSNQPYFLVRPDLTGSHFTPGPENVTISAPESGAGARR